MTSAHKEAASKIAKANSVSARKMCELIVNMGAECGQEKRSDTGVSQSSSTSATKLCATANDL